MLHQFQEPHNSQASKESQHWMGTTNEFDEPDIHKLRENDTITWSPKKNSPVIHKLRSKKALNVSPRIITTPSFRITENNPPIDGPTKWMRRCRHSQAAKAS